MKTPKQGGRVQTPDGTLGTVKRIEELPIEGTWVYINRDDGRQVHHRPRDLKPAPEGDHVVLKAHGGDRAKNLCGIADTITRAMAPGGMTPQTQHILKGYAEQLRIIAGELEPASDRCPKCLHPARAHNKDGSCVYPKETR